MTQPLHSIDILLAHETEATSALIAESLTLVGYRVAQARHLEEGFDALYAGKPQLVLINARMPDRAALKLAMAAKARGAKLLVIDDKTSPHETSPSIRAFTDAEFVSRRATRTRMVEAAMALIGPAGQANLEAVAAA